MKEVKETIRIRTFIIKIANKTGKLQITCPSQGFGTSNMIFTETGTESHDRDLLNEFFFCLNNFSFYTLILNKKYALANI